MLTRRDFLKGLGAALVTLVALPLVPKEPPDKTLLAYKRYRELIGKYHIYASGDFGKIGDQSATKTAVYDDYGKVWWDI